MKKTSTPRINKKALAELVSKKILGKVSPDDIIMVLDALPMVIRRQVADGNTIIVNNFMIFGPRVRRNRGGNLGLPGNPPRMITEVHVQAARNFRLISEALIKPQPTSDPDEA